MYSIVIVTGDMDSMLSEDRLSKLELHQMRIVIVNLRYIFEDSYILLNQSAAVHILYSVVCQTISNTPTLSESCNKVLRVLTSLVRRHSLASLQQSTTMTIATTWRESCCAKPTVVLWICTNVCV